MLFIASCLVTLTLSSVLEDAKPTAAALYQGFLSVGDEISRPEETGDRQADRQAFRDYREKVQARQKEEAARLFREHADLFGKGEGIFYRARIEMTEGESDAALASFRRYLDVAKDEALKNQARVVLVGWMQYTEPRDALQIFDAIDSEQLTGDAKDDYDRIAGRIGTVRERVALCGKPLPDLKVEAVLNGPKDFSLASCRGKVVVLDFWATWCPPCRALIPDLVKEQEHYGDRVQFIGVTRYYGRGMDFSGEGVELPHGGKAVNELDEEQELAVNRAFIEAFHLNYPVVFVGKDVAGTEFHVTGIPTVFVVGKDGRIVGHAVGGGGHEAVRKLIDAALATP